MTECDDCGEEVTHVWRHRAFGEAEAHRDVRWVCLWCHPELSAVTAETTETAETAETTETAEAEATTIVTDGGRSVCPDCDGETVNGQGLFDCLECGWTGTL